MGLTFDVTYLCVQPFDELAGAVMNTSSTMYCPVLPHAPGHCSCVSAGVVRLWEQVTRGDRSGHRGPSTWGHVGSVPQVPSGLVQPVGLLTVLHFSRTYTFKSLQQYGTVISTAVYRLLWLYG